MRTLQLCVLLVSAALTACGSRETGVTHDLPDAPKVAAASLPASFDGKLDLSMVESTEDENGGQIYLGEFTTAGETVFVLVAANLVDSAGIDDATEGTQVRATLSQREGSGGSTTYTISAVEKT